jgi:hypothetical protein
LTGSVIEVTDNLYQFGERVSHGSSLLATIQGEFCHIFFVSLRVDQEGCKVGALCDRNRTAA